MGVVYRAEDRFLGRTVAIKVLSLGGVAADPRVEARFEREARAAASLSHANIVSVFDAGSDGTTPFIVMEHVTGVSLADLLSRDGRLPVDHAVDVASQIGRGLAAAHRAGIVHRDVKPANVMINEAGTVKLLDFGIARARSSTTLTHAGSVLGSVSYIAPEVALGGAAEERSDVYSLGCVLYEMVTGQPPFSGELDAAVLHQHASAKPPRPRFLAPGIPQELDDLIMQVLSKRATERPSAASLAHALAPTPFRGTQRRAPRLANHRASGDATAPLPMLRRRRPRPRASLAVAALIVAGLAAMGLPATASNSRSANGSSESASTAAAMRRIANGGSGGRQSGSPLSVIARPFHVAARLAVSAAATLEAAQTSPSTAAPRPAASRSPRSPSKPHHRSKNQGAASEGREPEAPNSEREAEALPPVSQEAETAPVETAPAEAPPPPSTNGAPRP